MIPRLAFLVVALALGATPTLLLAQEAAPPARAEDVRRLLVLTGAEASATQMLEATLQQLRQGLPQVPQAFWEEVQASKWAQTLVERLVPVYAETFTQDEVEALIAFYEGPVGRRLLAAQPELTRRSMAVGGQLGEEVVRDVLRRLEAAR